MEKIEEQKVPKTFREYFGVMRESIHVYSWVWREMINDESKFYAKRMVAILGCAYLVSMTMPFLIGLIVDCLVVQDLTTAVYYIGAIAFTLFLSRGLGSFYFVRMREFILGENMKSLEEKSNKLFFEKSLGQHLREHDELSAANVEKGRGRVHEIQNMLLFEGVDAILSLTIAMVFLSILSWVAGAIMLVGMVVYFGWTLYLNLHVAQVCVPLEKQFRALNRHRVERWEQIERVKTCAKEAEEHAHMENWFKNIIDEDRTFWYWFIKHINVRGIFHVTALLAILYYGATKVVDGTYEVGLFVPLFVWSRMVTDNLWRVGHIEQRMNWNMPAVRSMMKALTIEPDIVQSENAIEITDGKPLRVEFSGVSFEYDESKKSPSKKRLPVLKNVSFDVKPGEVVGLLGKSGAGKTTIMRLLQRGMDPTHGNIRVNGIDLKDLNMQSVLEQMGYIAQQSAVLSGTLRYNLLYGMLPEEREKVTDEMLWDMMRKLEVDFGDRLTDGLDTKVGKKGVKLSGGEAQRVMIAAAVLKNPNMMIIDEATSSLDSTTEKSVQKGLAQVLQSGMSGLIIAHRLSTVRDICDKFVVMRPLGELVNGDSQVEAIGSSFEELWETSPTFRRLATDQGIVISQ